MIKVIFKRNVTRIATAFALVAMTALSSCEHKDLCFDHDSHSPKYKFRVEATYQQEWEIRSDGSTDWKNFSAWVDTYGMQYDDLRPLIPAGLRMHDFPALGPSDMINMPAQGDVVGLRPGKLRRRSRIRLLAAYRKTPEHRLQCCGRIHGRTILRVRAAGRTLRVESHEEPPLDRPYKG